MDVVRPRALLFARGYRFTAEKVYKFYCAVPTRIQVHVFSLVQLHYYWLQSWVHHHQMGWNFIRKICKRESWFLVTRTWNANRKICQRPGNYQAIELDMKRRFSISSTALHLSIEALDSSALLFLHWFYMSIENQRKQKNWNKSLYLINHPH